MVKAVRMALLPVVADHLSHIYYASFSKRLQRYDFFPKHTNHAQIFIPQRTIPPQTPTFLPPIALFLPKNLARIKKSTTFAPENK